MQTKKNGVAIVCDLQGMITRFVHDELGISERCVKGTGFVEVFDPASVEKAATFLSTVREKGGAFDWQLCVVIDGQITLLHAMGFSDGCQLWIILARTQVAASQVLEEMSLIQNEQTGMLRAALKFASQAGQTARDESQFEELTRLYNDMGTMQRDLAQRNAELETLRANLEIKQAELMAANAKLNALATLDGLTGIANRRTFSARLDAECAWAKRYQSALSLIMLDIDHFKGLNDSFGHQAGDEVLKMLGQILASTTRDTDLVARYGGEEFAIILVNTDTAAADIAAERFRACIEAAPWRHRAVTASIGISSFGDSIADPSALISRADRALYSSKRNGRNRVTNDFDIKSKDELVVVKC